MPLYEYRCEQCGAECELLVRRAEDVVCPECGGSRLEKRLSVPAAHVAGGSSSLPIAANMGAGCGRAGCGNGRCAMD